MEDMARTSYALDFGVSSDAPVLDPNLAAAIGSDIPNFGLCKRAGAGS
jgi:hypothetical protein